MTHLHKQLLAFVSIQYHYSTIYQFKSHLESSIHQSRQLLGMLNFLYIEDDKFFEPVYHDACSLFF